MFSRVLTPHLKVSTNNSIVKFHLIEKCLCSNKNFSSELPHSQNVGHKKKEAVLPKITLLTGNDINVITLEEAQKLAKRRDLKLVKIVDIDMKTHRPVYKLMTGGEYHEEDLKQRAQKKAERQNNAYKGEKVLMVSQNISEHDLQIHCSKIIKWLGKKYEVRIVVSGDSENIKKAEAVYSFLEEKLTEHGKIVQKRQKGSDIKFQVVPPKESKPISENDKKKGGTDNPI